METIILDNDISLFCIKAISFPEGILDAHEELRTLIPPSAERTYYGISRPENGIIIYRVGAENISEAHAEKLDMQKVVLGKGTYISMIVEDYTQNFTGIDEAFRTLLNHQGLDPQGYCVERYLDDKSVVCMVRLHQ